MAKLVTANWRNANSEGLTRKKLKFFGPKPAEVKLVSDDLIENIAMLVSMAAVVPFFEENNTQLGYWDSVFSRDILVRLAVSAAWKVPDNIQKTKAIFDQYNRLHEACVAAAGCMDPKPEREEIDEQFLSVLDDLLRLIDCLTELSEQFKDAPSVETDFSRAISRILPTAITELSTIFILFYPDNTVEIPTLLKKLMKSFDVFETPPQPSSRTPDQQRFLLKSRFVDVEQSLYRLQKECADIARQHFHALLGSEYNPQPHISLVLAFFRMYGLVVEQINGLPTRYLDYFYRYWLGQNPKAATADKVDIYITPSAAGDGTHLPSGTPFKCGKDADGQNIYYASKRDVSLSGATISALETITIGPDARNRLKINQQDVIEAETAWPLLSGTIGANEGRYTRFRFTGPALFLREGTRVLTFELTLASPSEADRKKLAIVLQKNNVGLNVDRDQCFLCAEISTAEGMQKIPAPAISVTWDEKLGSCDSLLTISFSLSPKFPELTPLDGMIAPSIEFYPAEDSVDIYTSPLRSLRLTQIELGLDLKDQVQTMEVGNGDMAAHMAMIMPFGVPSQNGGGFRATSPLFDAGLKISHVGLQWVWQGMPKSLIHHFAAYYRKLTKSKRERCAYQLQARLEPKGAEVEVINTQVSLDGLETTSIAVEDADPLGSGYEATALSVILKAPHFAMGHAHYGQLMAEATRNDARRRYLSLIWQSIRAGFRALLIPLIIRIPDSYLKLTELDKATDVLDVEQKPRNWRIGPWTLIRRFKKFRRVAEVLNIQPPCDVQMAEISMNFKAKLEIDFTQDSQVKGLGFEHMLPGGVKDEWHPKSSGVPLFPEMASGQEVHIGIDDLSIGQPFSLLWHIPCASASIGDLDQKVEWSILNANKWQVLSDKDILWDETDNLAHSGAIYFRLPAASLSANRVRRPGTYWLRASVNSDHIMERRCMGVYVNGVPLEHSADTQIPNKIINPKTVTGPVRKLPSVAKVQQPYSSYGGRPAETDEAFYQRVSWELDSRQRLVTPLHIEKAVLERFPDIESVKCLNATMPDGARKPGHITVVIATRPARDDGIIKIFVPPVICAEVKGYLSDKVSADITFYVRPPVEQALVVSATLELDQYADPLRWKQLVTTALKDAIYEATTKDDEIVIYGGLEYERFVSCLKGISFVRTIVDLSIDTNLSTDGSPLKHYRPTHPGGLFVAAQQFNLRSSHNLLASSLATGGING